MYLLPVRIAGGLIGLTKSNPLSGTVLMAIPDDGASGPALSVDLVASRGRTLCYIGLCPSRLLSTITHFAIFYRLSISGKVASSYSTMGFS